MKNQNQFYALQTTLENGNKLLCWQDKKHFYFAEKLRGFATPPPPTLFNTRKEADKAWGKIPAKCGNLKQFVEVVEAKKTKIVKVNIAL